MIRLAALAGSTGLLLVWLAGPAVAAAPSGAPGEAPPASVRFAAGECAPVVPDLGLLASQGYYEVTNVEGPYEATGVRGGIQVCADDEGEGAVSYSADLGNRQVVGQIDVSSFAVEVLVHDTLTFTADERGVFLVHGQYFQAAQDYCVPGGGIGSLDGSSRFVVNGLL